jgi:trk system potassium uptake protein TrkA
MKIVIVGCGRMGSGVALALSQRGHTVTVIDKDPRAFERLGPSFKGATVTGIAFDREALIKAGIERADGLAAVTVSDEINGLVARLARQIFRVPRVVARLYDPRKAEIYRRLGLQTVSTTAWGIQRMSELLGYSPLNWLTSIGSGEVDLVEAEVPHLLAGRTVQQLTIPAEAQVAALSRAGTTFLPTLGTVLEKGDILHLVILASSADRVKAVMGLA